jgi:hypothetical protein
MPDKRNIKVTMGPMVGPDGEPVSPEVEARVWAKLAQEVDRVILAKLPDATSAALARLADEVDDDTFQAVWRVIRQANLGLITPDEAHERLAEILPKP